MSQLQRGMVLVSVLFTSAVVASPAVASAIIGRNVTRATLTVDQRGRAHVSYYAGGRRRTLVAWGAVNARPPSRTVPQVRFRIHFGEGGRGVCLPYDGPPLAWLVKACTAPDGSYWALQRWQRLLPNLGVAPWRPEQAEFELHVSHWTGDIAKLDVYADWVMSFRYHELFGRLTYQGKAVYGFKSTSAGAPPAQARWVVGGPITVRGYDPGVEAGNAYWDGRLEVGTGFPGARGLAFTGGGWAGGRAAGPAPRCRPPGGGRPRWFDGSGGGIRGRGVMSSAVMGDMRPHWCGGPVGGGDPHGPPVAYDCARNYPMSRGSPRVGRRGDAQPRG